MDTATELGVDSKKFDAKLDPNLGVSLVNDAISAGAKGIAITVPDQTIGPAIAKAAKDAGVVLIATDDSIVDEAGNPVPFVGFDGKDMGKKVGEAAAKLLTDSGWLNDAAKKVGVLSVEVQTLSVCNDRTDNEKAAIIAAGVPEAKVFPVPYTGETLSAQDAAGPIITAHPDVTNWIVFGCNDEGVLGTLNALATAGVKPENIIGVGLGAYEACKPWAAGQDTGFKAALFISGSGCRRDRCPVLYDAVVNGNTSGCILRPNLHRGCQPTSRPPWIRSRWGTAPLVLPAAEPAAEKPLLVVINKSADQQYFIDLQNSFMDKATELGAGLEEVRCQARPEPGRQPGERCHLRRRQGHRHHRARPDHWTSHRQSCQRCRCRAHRHR